MPPKPPTRRPGTSALLVAGAIVLLVSIVIGQKLGDRVLLQTGHRVPIAAAEITALPDAEPSDHGELKNWKRLQVVSVATDPAFPDPRITPPPPPPPPRPPKPKPTPTPPPRTPPPPTSGIYTSPPLPIPLVSHEPNATETEPPGPVDTPPATFRPPQL